ncbi:hypothetical protein GKQ77_09100 [Streptomyces sp. BG9H]|uniref:Uncharacterized protein n=1 Tax=Streptomyces anatolicus TaxID=2675858 RepID=A0ABS6YMB7_9ACTN|nr:hypothetical protein [Streptomyces anatolicus]MBW5421722.1 hypothetical protein [Streptomyces anatolicus]
MLHARLESDAPRLMGYEGYGNALRPPNLSADLAARKAAIFEHYYIHDERLVNRCPGHYCAPTRKVADHYIRWLERNYPRRIPVARPGTIVSWIGSTDSGFTEADLCLTREGEEHGGSRGGDSCVPPAAV